MKMVLTLFKESFLIFFLANYHDQIIVIIDN